MEPEATGRHKTKVDLPTKKNDHLPLLEPTTKHSVLPGIGWVQATLAFQWRASSENELTIVSPASKEGSKCRGYHHQPATTTGQASFAHKAKTQKGIGIA